MATEGAKAIATSSWSVAAAQGYQDGDAITIELVGGISRKRWLLVHEGVALER